jgi:hypothetical protein
VGAPGSLLLTILGWIVTLLPLGLSTAFKLNLLAGLLAAFATALIARMAYDLCAWLFRDDPARPWPVIIAVSLGVLPLAFGPTLWTYALKFTPYGLTAVFTGGILFALVRWWQVAADGGIRWLFVVTLLIGIDFSVHRTNALLIPGVVLWVLIRRAGVLASLRAWVAAPVGLLLGLSFQLLLMPMAARSPALNMGVPSNWARLWEYISLQQIGGGFLVNLFPRRASFFEHQVGDVLDALHGSFAANGIMPFVGMLPLLCGLYGFVSMFRRKTRLAVALAVLFVSTVLTTVVYFNIPESYFRPLHRHYLPCLVIFAVMSAYGAGAAVAWLIRLGGRRGIGLTAVSLVLLAVVGAGRIASNYATQDRSQNYFAYDIARAMLNQLPGLVCRACVVQCQRCRIFASQGRDIDAYPHTVGGARRHNTPANTSRGKSGYRSDPHRLGSS